MGIRSLTAARLLFIGWAILGLWYGCSGSGEGKSRQRSIAPDPETMDVVIFLKAYLVPNIERVYEKVARGSPGDHFTEFRSRMEPRFRFLFREDTDSWDEFLSNVNVFLKRRNSRYKMRYHSIPLMDGMYIPSITIYKLVHVVEERVPIQQLSKLWGIDFSTVFRDSTFRIEYGGDLLVKRYDLWLQEKLQKIQLEGITFPQTSDIVLFPGKDSPLSFARQTLIHEFSHILFHRMTAYFTDLELSTYVLDVEQSLGEGQTTVSFSYYEFDELIAKLSELSELRDDELYDYIHELHINMMPQYQKPRQLICSTTVYRYLSLEHPEKFQALRQRMLTNEEFDSYLYELSLQETETGKNKLRDYLEYHIESMRSNLEVVFEL